MTEQWVDISIEELHHIRQTLQDILSVLHYRHTLAGMTPFFTASHCVEAAYELLGHVIAERMEPSGRYMLEKRRADDVDKWQRIRGKPAAEASL